jgi:hypothetical protein
VPWTELEIENWSDLVSEFTKMDFGRPSEVPRLFRGQSDAIWELEDTLSRRLTSTATGIDSIEIERIAFDKFFTQAHLLLDPSSLPKRCSVLAWWALMQHFGCPTRLLDWTASPYVATYFAVSENGKVPGAVWSFDPSSVLDASKSDTYLKTRKQIEHTKNTRSIFWGQRRSQFIYPLALRQHHVRLASQQGSFTVCGEIPSNHGRLIEQCLKDNAGGYCTKVID